MLVGAHEKVQYIIFMFDATREMFVGTPFIFADTQEVYVGKPFEFAATRKLFVGEPFMFAGTNEVFVGARHPSAFTRKVAEQTYRSNGYGCNAAMGKVVRRAYTCRSVSD